MSQMPSPVGWQQKAWQALILLLLVALGARVAAELLAPLIPGLIVLALLMAIFGLILRRRR